MSYCPECEAVIDEEFEDVGEIFICPDCGVELEVISLDPLEFDLALMDDEEDEDEFSFDDDDDDDDDWGDDELYDEDDDYEDDDR